MRARESLDEAVRLSGGENATRAFALAYLAMISCREGHDEEGSAYAERAYAVVDSPGMRNYMPSVGAYTMAAHLATRRGDLAIDSQRREELRNFRTAHLERMALAVKQDVPADPGDVCLLRAPAVVPGAHSVANNSSSAASVFSRANPADPPP